jgi:hypothetical protein
MITLVIILIMILGIVEIILLCKETVVCERLPIIIYCEVTGKKRRGFLKLRYSND